MGWPFFAPVTGKKRGEDLNRQADAHTAAAAMHDLDIDIFYCLNSAGFLRRKGDTHADHLPQTYGNRDDGRVAP
jgi:hypothetical protein